MIVVSVYRPEATDGPHQASYQDDFDPFNGVETLGIYQDDHLNLVMEMIERITRLRPSWKLHFSHEDMTVPRATMDVIERGPYVSA